MTFQNGNSYNTPPSSSHPSLWRAAIDGTRLALLVAFPGYPELRSRLVAIQQSARHKGELRHKGLEHVQFGPYLVRVWPAGRPIGHEGPYFAFIVVYEGIVIKIQDRAAPKGECPNVIVEIGGLVCLERGDLGALELAYDLIRQMGGEIDQVKLSRIDPCVDMPGVGMGEFVAAATERRYISKLKRHREIESDGTTLLFGKRHIQLAIYDKRAEVLAKQNPVQRALMLARRWGGSVMPAQAVRVEFRIWRTKLREFGIDTPEDFFHKRRTLVDYLCRDWFRFTTGPVDRQNTTRAATLPLWTQVHEAFAAWAGEPNGEVLEPLPKGPVNVDHYLKQCYGVTKAIGRKLGKGVVGYENYCGIVFDGVLI